MKKNPRLGSEIVRSGFLSVEQVKSDLVEQKKRQKKGENIKLGQLLVENGND